MNYINIQYFLSICKNMIITNFVVRTLVKKAAVLSQQEVSASTEQGKGSSHTTAHY